ncbi:MAG: NAD(P)/FAD-dependent oxidoreductase, partial [Candidatus Thorarchaeota archaeon]
MEYDVIVVGAGPAGSIAAYESAKIGLKTLLLEKFSLPRDKPCGGAVMYRALHILKGQIPSNIVERKIYGMRFILPNGEEAEFVSDKLMGITVFRSKFDEFLARRAVDAGATLIENARVIDVTTCNEYADVRVSDGTVYRGAFVIGADGVNSIVSRSLGLRPKRKDLSTIGLGMESDIFVGEDGVNKVTCGDPSILEIAPIGRLTGYGWVFPKREHLAIGVAGASQQMHPLRQIFENFRRNLEQKFGIPMVAKKKRTHFFGGDCLGSKNVANRAILVGDAAGFVDPLMGEGIGYAMKSGIHAVCTIEHCLKNGLYDETNLSMYQDLCINEFEACFGIANRVGA